MADGKLLLFRPASGSAKLVLGDAPESAVVIPSATVGIDAGFGSELPATVMLGVGRMARVDAVFAAEGIAELQLL